MKTPVPRRARRLLSRVAVFIAITVSNVGAQTWQLDPKTAPVIVNDLLDLALPTLALRAYPDIGFLLTGSFFNHVDDVPSPKIARLHRDLTIDRTFAAEVAANETLLSAAPLANGGAVLVVEHRGYPGNPNGSQSRFSLEHRILRLRADGRRNPNFPPIVISGAARLASLPDGRCIAYGDFQFATNVQRRGLVRFDSDGAVDDRFAPALALGSFPTVLAGPAGTLIVSESGSNPFIARLRVDGSLDASFTPALRIGHTALAVQPDGSVIALTDNRLVRFRSDGSHDPAYAQHPALAPVRKAVPLRGGRVAMLAAVKPGPPFATYGPIYVLTAEGTIERELTSAARNGAFETITDVLPDDRLLVVEGSQVMTSPGGTFLADRIAVLVPADGRAVASFPPRIAVRSASVVRGVTLDSNGRALIHGSFSHVNGQPCAGIARMLPSGELDPSFAPAGLSHSVLLALPDGGAITRSNVISTTEGPGLRSYASLIARLRPDGTVDPAFGFTIPAVSTQPEWLLAAPDGRILIYNARLMWVSPNGSLLATLPTTFGGAPGGARLAVRLLADGRLLVGGKFTHVNDVARPHLVRLLGDGAIDSTYAPDFSPLLNIESAQPLPDGRAVVFGYVWIRGVFTPRAIRLQPDGSVERDYQLAARSAEGVLLPDGAFVTPQRRFGADGRLDLNYASELWSGNVPGTVDVAATGPDGSLWIGGRFDEVSPEKRFALARYLPIERRTITVGPRDTTVARGGTTKLEVATGTVARATYQWSHDGTPLPGATRSVLEIADARFEQAGTYRVLVTIAGRIETSAPATLTVAPNTARLVNLSARSKVEPDVPQIAGFVCVAPAGPRTALLRAVGFGFPGSAAIPMLPVPVLSLQEGARPLGTDRGSVNSPTVAALARTVGAFPISNEPLNPTWIRGSALMPEVGSGAFSAITTSGNGNSGLSLFEFYDTGAVTAPPLARNLSIRGQTSPGVNVLTAGFVIAGNGPLRVLVRGIGPSLAAFGVNDVLPDPVLRVHASGVTLPLATNAAWSNDAAIAAAAASAGAFPLSSDSRDTALLLTLEPGAYTVQLSGAADSTGIALIELYALDP